MKGNFNEFILKGKFGLRGRQQVRFYKLITFRLVGPRVLHATSRKDKDAMVLLQYRRHETHLRTRWIYHKAWLVQFRYMPAVYGMATLFASRSLYCLVTEATSAVGET